MKIYNTLSRTIEEFVPIDGKNVKMYTCGPTVYSYAHIGNMRNYIGHDILEKSLRYLGFSVTRCMNITDVGHLTSDSDSGEDKMEKAAKKEHKTSMEIADFYTKAFFEDFKLINCKVPEIVSKATDNIDFYLKIISKLLDEGYAYQSGGNVYFDTSKLNDYYCLTNHREDEMVVGARDSVEEDNNKKNQADFVLWFTSSKFANHELLWDSPYGRGYPGWHIECTGISIKYLGDYLDIHGGGVDNIFPHHTNEIAQSEAYLGHKWCNYWFHNEHLLDSSGKMSKSKGAVLSVSKLKKMGYNPLSYRFMCLNSHYRKQLMFSYDILKQNSDILDKLKSKISNISNDGNFSKEDFDNYNNKFISTIEDDLNTSNALTVLYDVIKDNSISGNTKISLIKSFDKVFSLDLFKNDSDINISSELESYVLNKIEERNKFKSLKDYSSADKIRDELLEKGIKLIDSREGTKYEII